MGERGEFQRNFILFYFCWRKAGETFFRRRKGKDFIGGEIEKAFLCSIGPEDHQTIYLLGIPQTKMQTVGYRRFKAFWRI